MKNGSRTEVPEAEDQVGNGSTAEQGLPQRTCTTPFCDKWHPPECLFYKTKSGCRFGEKCSYAHRQVEEQPSKRSQKNGDTSAVAMLKITRQMGCVFQDTISAKIITEMRGADL